MHVTPILFFRPMKFSDRLPRISVHLNFIQQEILNQGNDDDDEEQHRADAGGKANCGCVSTVGTVEGVAIEVQVQEVGSTADSTVYSGDNVGQVKKGEAPNGIQNDHINKRGPQKG